MTTRVTIANAVTAEVRTVLCGRRKGNWYAIDFRDSAGKLLCEVSVFGATDDAGENLEAVKWTFDDERLNYPAPEMGPPRLDFVNCRGE